MRECEVNLLCAYIYNNRIMYERQIEESQARLRFRDISETECFELALLKERYNTFLEVTGQIQGLLKLKGVNEL